MTNTVHAGLYAEIQHFYAAHMQLLDDGRIEEWAAHFTEDGTFATDVHPIPARGRAELIAGARHTIEQLESEGVVRRHWLGMSAVAREEDNLRVRSYALVLQSTEQGVTVRASTTCEDVLVPDGPTWLIRERLVHRDTAP
ncbi:MAG: hydroxylacyl-CoA dehydrogenase [Mycobacterium sp.]|jgi:3-phenylpropionate/cinnamic acid dioxygenase small subunit|nr:hydroxylacyl-CoA dehydrogenase [Mycobacterium sp.]